MWLAGNRCRCRPGGVPSCRSGSAGPVLPVPGTAGMPSWDVGAAAGERRGIGVPPAAGGVVPGLSSMPVNRRPRARAARPVVPVPQNGSSTVPPGLQPALMQRVGRSMGKAAKCGPRKGRVGIDHTSPGFRPLGWQHAPSGVAVRADDLPGVRAVLRPPGAGRGAAGPTAAGAGAAWFAVAGVPPGCRYAARPSGAARTSAGRTRTDRGVPGMRHADRVEVEPVVPGLDQQEDQLVPAVEPVAH